MQNHLNRSIWDIPWFTIPVLLAFLGGLLFMFLVPYRAEILMLNAWRMEPLNAFFWFWTKMGETYPYLVALFLCLFWRFRYALLIGIAGILVLPYAYFLKDWIGVMRPLNWLGEQGLRDKLVVVPYVELASGYTSFPSGHTIAAFTLYTLLALMVPKSRAFWGLLFAIMAVLVGISRVFLAQHFVADVLGGVVFGLLLASVVWQIGQTAAFRTNTGLDRNLFQITKKQSSAPPGIE
jgi:membrane-associated phospholipid phosphatase